MASLGTLCAASPQALLLHVVRLEGFLPALPSLGQEPDEPGAEPPPACEGLEALDGGVLHEGRGDPLGCLEGPWQVLVRENQVVGVVSRPAVCHNSCLGLFQVEVPASLGSITDHQREHPFLPEALQQLPGVRMQPEDLVAQPLGEQVPSLSLLLPR